MSCSSDYNETDIVISEHSSSSVIQATGNYWCRPVYTLEKIPTGTDAIDSL